MFPTMLHHTTKPYIEVDNNCVLMMDPDADESVFDFLNEVKVKV